MSLRARDAVAALLMTIGAFAWCYILRPLRSRHLRLLAALQLRRLPGRGTLWLALAAWPLAHSGLARLLEPDGPTIRVPVRGEQAYPAEGARLAPLLVLVVGVPLIDEFFLRGFIQHRLERQLGAGVAILGTALLFAAPLRSSQGVALEVADGLAYGTAAHRTRSTWAAVLMHAGSNLADLTMLPMHRKGGEDRSLPSPAIAAAARRPGPVWSGRASTSLRPPRLGGRKDHPKHGSAT